MKKLIICRHSHAEGSHVKGDFYRKLDKKGKKRAHSMGERFRELNLGVDMFISSPAKRAYQTAEIFAEALEYDLDRIVTDQCIYEQDVCGIIALLKNICKDEDTVMLFGHCPSVQVLPSLLSETPQSHTPTCSITAVGFDEESWEDALNSKGCILFRELP